MTTKGTRDLTPAARILLVISCACITGFMWRVRGSLGFGSMWGMFAVGVTLVLFIYAFFGNRRKMCYESIPIAVLLLGITNGSWGTLNTQIGGYIHSTVPFAGTSDISVVEINPFSGLAIMLLLGFGWMPLFALFIGSLFSKKEYKVHHYVIFIAVFYAAYLLFRFFAAHYILPLICPEAAENFAAGLADSGIDMNPLTAFIKNLGSTPWAKKIPFGRNYFACIDAISRAAAALVSALAAIIIFKDKLTVLIGLGIDTVCALAITIANLPMNTLSDRDLLSGIEIHEFFTRTPSPVWEFLTGFLLGLGIMLILVCLPEKTLNGEGKYKEKSFFGKTSLRFIYGSVLVLFFPFGLVSARALGMRLSNSLTVSGVFEDSDVPGLIIMAVISVILLAVCLIIGKKNYLDKGIQVPVPMRIEDFCMNALPVWFLINMIIYYFAGSENILVDFNGIDSAPEFFSRIADGTLSVFTLTASAAVIFYITYFAARKMTVKKFNEKKK